MIDKMLKDLSELSPDDFKNKYGTNLAIFLRSMSQELMVLNAINPNDAGGKSVGHRQLSSAVGLYKDY